MWTLLTYFSRYKSIDPVAGLPLPDLAGRSLREYPKAFDLEPRESKRDRNRRVLHQVTHNFAEFLFKLNIWY